MKMEIVVREFDEEKDYQGAQRLEAMCDVDESGSGKISLTTDLLGDLISRVRHSPPYRMLVAEATHVDEEDRTEIVGIIRGCIKLVTCSSKTSPGDPQLPSTKVAYILGLRVSPNHRRMGIAFELVTRLEQWFSEMDVEYAYIATAKDNEASVGLFTGKCSYTVFRTLSVLVHPVFRHHIKIPRQVVITKLNSCQAEELYRLHFSTTDFFPRDINSVLNNPLCLGTFLAFNHKEQGGGGELRKSWAVVSIWNCMEVLRFELKGVSKMKRGLAKVTRMLDGMFPWLKIPSFPNLFEHFGCHFLFGIGGEGPLAGDLLTALCTHAHNTAREGGCEVVATEVGSCHPLRWGIPHWKILSCDEDLWCIKRLSKGGGGVALWTKAGLGQTIFVDPREV